MPNAVAAARSGSEIDLTKINIVSNREFFQVLEKDGRVEFDILPGGLATAMAAVVNQRTSEIRSISSEPKHETRPDGRRVLSTDEIAAVAARNGHGLIPCRYQGVELTVEQKRAHYIGVANSTLWPAMHSEHERFKQSPENDWLHYKQVNRQFVEAVLANPDYRDAPVWWHDYHLMLAPAMQRAQQPDAVIGYFHHIPFPKADELTEMLSEQHTKQLVDGLLGADLIGFHVQGYVDNFLACCQKLGYQVNPEAGTVEVGGRVVRVEKHPISIDYEATRERALSTATRELEDYMRKTFKQKYIAVGLDRLDYTKGIPERMLGMEYFFCSPKNAEYRGQLSLIQYVSPSRGEVGEYQDLAERTSQLVADLNHSTGTKQWEPIHYHEKNLSEAQKLALLRRADIVVVNAIVDGMNLVILEAIAASDAHDHPTIFVLGKGTGAAQVLPKTNNLLLVDGGNPTKVAAAMQEGLRRLKEETDEVKRSMEILHQHIKKHPVEVWARNYLESMSTAASQRYVHARPASVLAVKIGEHS